MSSFCRQRVFDKYEWIYLPTDREGLVCLVAWLFVGLTRRTPNEFYIANYYHALKVPNEHCFGDHGSDLKGTRISRNGLIQELRSLGPKLVRCG